MASVRDDRIRNNKGGFVMNTTLNIAATLDQPELLENLVEKLAHKRYRSDYGMEKMPDDRKAFETSSTETFVSGAVALTTEEEQINMPFITRFMFTCISMEEGNYKLEWSASLS